MGKHEPDYHYCEIRHPDHDIVAVYDEYHDRCPGLDFDLFVDDEYLLVIGELEDLQYFAKVSNNQFPILRGYYTATEAYRKKLALMMREVRNWARPGWDTRGLNVRHRNEEVRYMIDNLLDDPTCHPSVPLSDWRPYKKLAQRDRELYAIMLAAFEHHTQYVSELPEPDKEAIERDRILMETLRDAFPANDNYNRDAIQEYLDLPFEERPFMIDWFESRLLDVDEWLINH